MNFFSLTLFIALLSSTYLKAMEEEKIPLNSFPVKKELSPPSSNRAKKILSKYQDYLETEIDFYEDQLKYLQDAKNEYETLLSTQSKDVALRRVCEILGSSIHQSVNFLYSDIEVTLARLGLLAEHSKEIQNILKSKKTFTEKATQIFLSLLKRHDEQLGNRLIAHKFKEIEWKLANNTLSVNNLSSIESSYFKALWTSGKSALYLPPTSPSYIEKMPEGINKNVALSATDTYKDRVYFLAKFYPLSESNLVNDKPKRARVELDKNLYAVLTGKTKDLGDPDQGLETFPTEEDIQKAKGYWQATSPKSPLLIYLQRPSKIDSDMVFWTSDAGRTPKINWDKVTLSNIDIILSQVNHFFPWVSGDALKKVEKQIAEKKILLQEQEKEKDKNKAPTFSLHMVAVPTLTSTPAPIENDKSFSSISSSIDIGRIPALEINQSFMNWSSTPKTLKDREKRRRAYEEKKRLEEEKPDSKKKQSSDLITGNEDNHSMTFPRLSPKTIQTLSQIFKDEGPKKALKWKNFISAWKELREVVDGVANAKPGKKKGGGSSRKFVGGPPQEGRKEKPRSFSLHKPLHKPHSGTIGPKTTTRIQRKFQDKFGWTPEKLKNYGFNSEEK